MNLIRNSIVFSLGCILVSAKPVFSAGTPNARKSGCVYTSSALVYTPLSSKTKFYPSTLTTYSRGIAYTACAPDNVETYLKIDCISRVLYYQQKDGTYIKHAALGSSSPGAAMCNKYF